MIRPSCARWRSTTGSGPEVSESSRAPVPRIRFVATLPFVAAGITYALLFVVAFYIYPLKFLFTTLVDGLTGFRPMLDGMPVPRMNRDEWSQLMLIYGAGFIGLYVIFALLYLHAYRMRDALELNPLEAYETRGVVQENVLMIGIGVLSCLLAWQRQPSLAGMSYMLIAPAQTWLGMRHGKRRKLLAERHAASPVAA